MDSITVKCANCDSKLASLVNLWIQIGKKYITPVAYPEDSDGSAISETGAVRSGDADTLVDGCELRDAECSACQTNIGQKCLTSPVNHVLHDGQLIFRASSITMKLNSDMRRKAEPKIQRVLKLRGDPSFGIGQTIDLNEKQDHAPSKVRFDIYQIQTDLEAQQEEIQRIGAAGFQVMSSFETAIARFEKQMQQLNDSVDGLRKDGEGQRNDIKVLNSELTEVKWSVQGDSVVTRLDQQLQTTDRVVTELRQALGKTKSNVSDLQDELNEAQQELRQVKQENASLKVVVQDGVTTSKQYVSEVTSLRRELKQLRSELAADREQSPVGDDSIISSHQLDILTSNISKIGNRASRIESLQMEFDLFKTRFQRLEARASSTPMSVRNDANSSVGEYASLPDQSAKSQYGENPRQKRPSIGTDDHLTINSTPPKRLAISSDYPGGNTVGYVSAGEAQQSSPPDALTTDSPIQRRVKAATSGRGKLTRGHWKTKK